MNVKYKDFKFISVIVPVYNEEKNIGLLLKRLLNLNFPKDKFEIIVVDNNSKDRTSEIVKEFQVTYLCEKKQSSYAARNKGIKKAKGNILAFIDGDCIPDKDWLKNVITHFINEDVDIIAGNIILSINYSISLKLIDIYQLIAMGERQKNSEKEGRCAGGNLIAKKEIFEKIGYFDERLISGGDGEWTKRATMGLRLDIVMM
jgi:glycosyltransferase involved in cell wall biosynthesis